jgi:hypothetical protein
MKIIIFCVKKKFSPFFKANWKMENMDEREKEREREREISFNFVIHSMGWKS